MSEKAVEVPAQAIEIGSIAAWGAVAVAVVAVLLAVRQFWLARKAQQQQAEIARANLLLSIDSTFEGPELYKARKAIRSLRNRIEAEVNASNPEDKAPDAIRAAVAIKFSRKLNVMWEVARTFSDEDVEDETSKARIGIDRYYELLTLPNWIETVGMMCVRGLLPKEDILSLYAGVVITTMFNFKSHVEARRSSNPIPIHDLWKTHSCCTTWQWPTKKCGRSRSRPVPHWVGFSNPRDLSQTSRLPFRNCKFRLLDRRIAPNT